MPRYGRAACGARCRLPRRAAAVRASPQAVRCCADACQRATPMDVVLQRGTMPPMPPRMFLSPLMAAPRGDAALPQVGGVLPRFDDADDAMPLYAQRSASPRVPRLMPGAVLPICRCSACAQARTPAFDISRTGSAPAARYAAPMPPVALDFARRCVLPQRRAHVFATMRACAGMF